MRSRSLCYTTALWLEHGCDPRNGLQDVHSIVSRTGGLDVDDSRPNACTEMWRVGEHDIRKSIVYFDFVDSG